jgi:hypothetical protein
MATDSSSQAEDKWLLVLGEITRLRHFIDQQQQQHDEIFIAQQQQIAVQRENLENLNTYFQELLATIGDYRPPNHSPMLSELQGSIAAIQEKQNDLEQSIEKHSPIHYLPAIEKMMASVKDRLENLEKIVYENEATVRTNFNVKAIGVNTLMMSLVTSLAVVIAIRLLPLNPDLMDSLSLIYKNIEQVRKQIRR